MNKHYHFLRIKKNIKSKNKNKVNMMKKFLQNFLILKTKIRLIKMIKNFKKQINLINLERSMKK